MVSKYCVLPYVLNHCDFLPLSVPPVCHDRGPQRLFIFSVRPVPSLRLIGYPDIICPGFTPDLDSFIGAGHFRELGYYKCRTAHHAHISPHVYTISVDDMTGAGKIDTYLVVRP